MRPREATPADLDAVWAVEEAAFEGARRASRRSILRSFGSAAQRVWVLGEPVVAFAVVWVRRRTHRLYDIAVHPDQQGKGLGDALLHHVEAEARRAGATSVVLEADPRVPGLVPWYEKRGYAVGRTCPDHYGPGHDAVRMAKRVATDQSR